MSKLGKNERFVDSSAMSDWIYFKLIGTLKSKASKIVIWMGFYTCGSKQPLFGFIRLNERTIENALSLSYITVVFVHSLSELQIETNKGNKPLASRCEPKEETAWRAWRQMHPLIHVTL